MSLRTVFQQDDLMILGHLTQRVPIRRVPIEVYGQHSPRLRATSNQSRLPLVWPPRLGQERL